MPTTDDEFMVLAKDLDAKAFWQENALCSRRSTDKPRCEASFSPDDHWLLEFLTPPSTRRYYQDKAYRDSLNQEANRLTAEQVGREFFEADTWEHQPRRIENLFGSEFTYVEGSTPWLTAVTDDADDFSRVLDRAEATDLGAWALPDPFLAEWEHRKAEGKPLPSLGTGSRGPATIMTSVLHTETAVIWLYDYPELMARFRDILARKMIELNQIFREFSGNTRQSWWVTDDNCALFNRPLYREFCFPVLQQVFNALAPDPQTRYQHSDSAMGHLLDYQRELGVSSVNYGPEVPTAQIRHEMPEALINGHLPPFLLRNGTPSQIRQRIIDDFEVAGAEGRLLVTTAGSLAAGTTLGRMRYFMKCVQECCRYDRA